MVIKNDYLAVVAETKVDAKEIDLFYQVALKDTDFRNILVNHLLNNDTINIYYHSYIILSKIANKNPGILYCYWDSFIKLLNYNNSYHRNYGMDLISCLLDNVIDIKKSVININELYKYLICSK